jgi:hypothetical protein
MATLVLKITKKISDSCCLHNRKFAPKIIKIIEKYVTHKKAKKSEVFCLNLDGADFFK